MFDLEFYRMLNISLEEYINPHQKFNEENFKMRGGISNKETKIIGEKAKNLKIIGNIFEKEDNKYLNEFIKYFKIKIVDSKTLYVLFKK
jgi:hypothetical protein